MAKMIKTLSSLYGFLCLLYLFFFINQTISQPDHMYTFCNQFSDNFTRTSSYRTNRETLLSTLLDRSSLGTYSYATTGLSPNTVHVMFLCRGDITRTSCSDCVQTALEIARNCTYQKEAFIFYEECMVRYSDFSFLTLVEERPNTIRYLLTSAPNSNRFGQTLSDKMNELIFKASSSSSSSSIPYFVGDQEHVTQFEGSYDLDSIVQCSPDLDSRNCTVCLRYAVEKVLDCCSRSRSAQIFTPKCLLKYEASALPSPPPPSPPPPPPSPSFLLPSPPLFPGPQNVPSFSGSISINIRKGNENIGRVFIAVMTVYVLAHL